MTTYHEVLNRLMRRNTSLNIMEIIKRYVRYLITYWNTYT